MTRTSESLKSLLDTCLTLKSGKVHLLMTGFYIISQTGCYFSFSFNPGKASDIVVLNISIKETLNTFF